MIKQGPLSGKVLGEKYLLGDLLGKGGFGAVYNARHLILDRPQAIKLLLDHHLSQPKFAERFLREARALAALDHPHIVHIDDFFSDEQTSNTYLVMPFVANGTFRHLLRRRQQPLSLDEVATYLEQICHALDYAHQHNVVHLDLKPQNLLVHADGRLLLSDFGLAHMIKQDVVEGGSSLYHGSPHYMSPEHLRGKPERSSDIYSLGIILYEMLTGQLPFRGETPEAIMLQHITEQPSALSLLRPEIPTELETIIQCALNKQANQRYQTALALLTDFQDALTRQQRRQQAEIQMRQEQEEEALRKAQEYDRQQKLEHARKEAEEHIRLRLEAEMHHHKEALEQKYLALSPRTTLLNPATSLSHTRQTSAADAKLTFVGSLLSYCLWLVPTMSILTLLISFFPYITLGNFFNPYSFYIIAYSIIGITEGIMFLFNKLSKKHFQSMPFPIIIKININISVVYMFIGLISLIFSQTFYSRILSFFPTNIFSVNIILSISIGLLAIAYFIRNKDRILK